MMHCKFAEESMLSSAHANDDNHADDKNHSQVNILSQNNTS
jgi:hypothetical protein